MNILFLMAVLEVGGQEVVTATLANSFAGHGHNVSVVSFNRPNPLILTRFDNQIEIFELSGYKVTEINVQKLNSILITKNIDLVINQWGLPYIPAKVLNKARVGLNLKIIAVYHNQVGTNARLKEVEIDIENCQNPIKKQILHIKHYVFKLITSRSMRYVYDHSDIYEVLSQTFVDRFKLFTGIKNPQKLIVQTNPITITNYDFKYDFINKQKEIIYVGRIDYNQKRTFRLIDVWKKLECKFPDWKLSIVGDGVEKENIESKTAQLGLKNVFFEGFQNPIEYYKRASILVLVSEYEGFPLVLAEAMSFGVIPAVYYSYSAAIDIVTNEVDGILVNKPIDCIFPTNGFAEKLAELMTNDDKRFQMQIAAIEKSKKFSLDVIYNQWESTFKKMYEKD